MSGVVDIEQPVGLLRHRRRRPSPPSTDVSLSVAAGEVLAIVGRERQRQDRHRAQHPRPAARRPPPPAAPSCSPARTAGSSTTSSTLTAAQLREVRGRDAAMVFQEPSTALNPVYTVGWQIAEGLRAHGKYTEEGGPRQGDRRPPPGRHPRPGAAGRPLPAPVLRRAEAAHRHRPGAGARPRRDHRRRADHRPRRHRAGRDPRPAAPLPRRVRHRDRADHPQHGRGRRPRRPGRGHVPGPRSSRRPTSGRCSPPRRTPTPSSCWPRCPRLGQGTARTAGARRGAGRPAGRARRPSSRRGTCGSSTRAGSRQPDFVAVDGVSFAIRPGEVLGLVGESGSGKTTIGRAIAGLTKVTGGSLKVLGTEMNGVKERVVPAGPRADRVRLPGPGVELQPAADHRRRASPSR